MKPVRKKFPGATPYFDRHGKRWWRYRKGGRLVELGTEYGSDDFVERYEAAVKSINLRKRLMQLLDHAIALDWISTNPARLVKPYKLDGSGFHTWDEGEIARSFQVYESGTMAHTAVTLIVPSQRL